MSDRAEHLAWCKQRALEYVDQGELQNAFASLASDLGKHEDTRGVFAEDLAECFNRMMHGDVSTPEQMRDFIEGFN